MEDRSGGGRIQYTSKTVRPGSGGDSRYTDIFVTVNTNRKPKSEAEENMIYDHLEGLINDVMMTEQGLKEILPMANPEAIHEVTMPNLSLETGKKPRGGRVHAHFILNIVHGTLFQLKRANSSFKAWFDSKLMAMDPGGYNGCNAMVILLTTSKLKNYIAKTGKSPPGAIINNFV